MQNVQILKKLFSLKYTNVLNRFMEMWLWGYLAGKELLIGMRFVESVIEIIIIETFQKILVKGLCLKTPS